MVVEAHPVPSCQHLPSQLQVQEVLVLWVPQSGFEVSGKVAETLMQHQLVGVMDQKVVVLASC